MKNLEDVVRERNKAYHMLETGETGERPGRMVRNPLGLRFFYREFEHIIPRFMNRKWRETHNFYHGGYAVNKFLKLYREKLYNEKRKSRKYSFFLICIEFKFFNIFLFFLQSRSQSCYAFIKTIPKYGKINN